MRALQLVGRGCANGGIESDVIGAVVDGAGFDVTAPLALCARDRAFACLAAGHPIQRRIEALGFEGVADLDRPASRGFVFFAAFAGVRACIGRAAGALWFTLLRFVAYVIFFFTLDDGV
jgi:hypothetical protein